MERVNLIKVFIGIVVVALVIGILYKIFNGKSKTNKYETKVEKVDEVFSVKGADGKEYNSYQEACRACDFEAAHEYVDQLYSRFVKELDDTDPSGANAFNRSIEGEKEFMSAEDYVFKQEMMFLMSDGSEQMSDKVLYLLTEIQVIGQPLSPGYNDYYDKDCLPQRLYTEYVKRFNSHCDQILDLAISQGNPYLANKVVKMYKQNVIVLAGGYNETMTAEGKTIQFDGNHCYVYYTNDDRDVAQKRLKDAKI